MPNCKRSTIDSGVIYNSVGLGCCQRLVAQCSFSFSRSVYVGVSFWWARTLRVIPDEQHHYHT